MSSMAMLLQSIRQNCVIEGADKLIATVGLRDVDGGGYKGCHADYNEGKCRGNQAGTRKT